MAKTDPAAREATDGYRVDRWRAAFPALRRTHEGVPVAYLDGPGGSQVPQQVLEAMLRYLVERNANTGGAFAASASTDALIAEARAAVADLFGAAPGAPIAFGANMTGLSFALAHAAGRDLAPGDEVVVTEIDHDANVAPWLTLAERGAVVRMARMDPETGTLDVEHLLSLLGPRTRWVAVGWASNALGSVNSLGRVIDAAHAVGARVVVDAVHWAPHGPMDVASLGMEFCLASAYKFFGPHVGVMYGRPEAFARLRTDRVRGQSSEPPQSVETGTLNHEGIAGTIAAVAFIASMAEGQLTGRRTRLVRAMEQVYGHEHALGAWLWGALGAIPGVRRYGPPFGDAARAPTISFTVDGRSAREVTRALAGRGLCLWDGDFYALGVVARLGLAGRGGLVRVGVSPYTEKAELVRVAEGVEEVARGRS